MYGMTYGFDYYSYFAVFISLLTGFFPPVVIDYLQVRRVSICKCTRSVVLFLAISRLLNCGLYFPLFIFPFSNPRANISVLLRVSHARNYSIRLPWPNNRVVTFWSPLDLACLKFLPTTRYYCVVWCHLDRDWVAIGLPRMCVCTEHTFR